MPKATGRATMRNERHPKQRPAIQLEEFGGVRGGLGQVDDVADKRVKRDLDERSQQAEQP